MSTVSLSRYVTVSPQQDLRDDSFQAKKYQFYSVAVVVGYIALAIIGNLAMHTFAPAYLPLAVMLALGLMPVALPLARKMYNTSQSYQSALKVDQAVVNKFNQLQQSQPKKQDLHAIMARYQVWAEQPKLIEKDAKTLAEAAAKSTDAEAARELRREALDMRIIKLRDAKLRAAFFYGLMQHPTYQGVPEDVCDLMYIPGEDRLLAREFKDKNADAFIIFKDKQFGEITGSRFDRLSIPQIAGKIFNAAKAA